MTTRTDTGAALPIATHKRYRGTVKSPGGSQRGTEVVVDVDFAWQVLDVLKNDGLVPDEDFDIAVRREPAI